MSDILASVSVVLGAEISGFKAAMANARKELKGLVQFSEGLKDIGSSLTTYVSAPLALLGAASVAASAKMESLKKGIEAITAADLGKQGITGLAGLQLAASQAGDRLKVLETIAKAPGIGFEQAVAGDIRLRAVGITAEQSAKSLKEFANAIATTGGGASEFDRVTTQLAQLSAKGKVLSQDLRPIIEAAPAVSQALLKLYGTIDSETISASLTKQGKSSQDFIAVLTDELAKLPRVTGGLANAFENLQQTAVQSAAKLGDGISKALNLPGLTEGLASAIERLGNGFAALSPGTQKLIVGLGVAAAAIGPILLGIGTLGAALPALTAGFATLGITSAAALGPIGIGIAAVAVGAALIIDHWEDLTAYFSASGEGGRVFGDLATSVTNSIDQISDAFSALNSSGNFGDLVSATGVFKAIFRDIAVGATAVSNVVGGLIGTFVELGRGIKDTMSGTETYGFSRALQQAETALVGLVQPLANVLGFQLRLAEATQGTKEKFDALAVATPGLAAVLDRLAATSPFPIVDVGAATRTLGLLEQLKARLKEVQDQRDKETTVPAIKVDNAEILSLQKQIAALEGTDKAGKKATDAITKLRQELARLTALDNLLGNTPSQVEVLERRTNALTAGLKTLVDAGVSTSSRAFRGFAADLVTTSQALDKIRGASGDLQLTPAKLTGLVPTTIGDTLPRDVARLLGDYAKKPIELPLKVLVKVDEVGFTTQPLKLLNQELVRLGQGFREIDGAAQLGINFDSAGSKAQVLQGAIQNLLAGGLSPASAELKQLSAQFKQLSIDAQATQAVKASVIDLASGISEAFANATSGMQGIGDSLLQTLLSTVGNLATQLGGILLAAGLGIEALKVSLSTFTGVGAIAAGLGLLAIGGIAKGAAANIGKSAGGAGGGGGSPTVTNYGQNSNSTQKIVVEVVSRLRGQDLVAIGQGNAYRNRVGG
jgi:tape measure domain-containing protein